MTLLAESVTTNAAMGRFWAVEYAIKTELGTVLWESTHEQLTIDLSHLAMLYRHHGRKTEELEVFMSNLDWNSEVESWIDAAGGWEGLATKAAQAKVVGNFEKLLKKQQKEMAQLEKERAERAENRRANIYAAYESLGTEIAPEPTVIMSTMLVAGVSPSDIGDEQEALKEEIHEMLAEEILGRVAGPSGGLLLCKTAEGEPTETYTERKAGGTNIVHGAIVRGRRS